MATTEYAIGGGGGIAGLAFELFGYAQTNRPADARTHAAIYYIKGEQQPDGHWRGGGSRPPLTFDDFTPTALMIRALDTYAPAVDAADTKARIAPRARGSGLRGPSGCRSTRSRCSASPG
jgi:hypothetical protein